MIKHFFAILLLICTSLLGRHFDCETSLQINIFCEARSGLERDQSILKKALESFGHTVNCCRGERNVPQADINIFCESLYPKYFSAASLNWFIPNPEWYTQDKHLLKQVDLILCRTHEVERIFSNLNKETYYLGFTSSDRLDLDQAKDYSSCIHLAGTSWQKGTEAILKAWVQHPEFPHLNIIRFPGHKRKVPDNVTWMNHWLPEKELALLQNHCGIHLCLSETEGFGHYLVEAMAVGAVVIATDAPPMNEFITDPRCLVPYNHWRLQKLGTNFYVNFSEIEAKVAEILKLPISELEAIGETNRNNYLKRREEFFLNLKKLLDKTSTQKSESE